jgi:hypothetical protein
MQRDRQLQALETQYSNNPQVLQMVEQQRAALRVQDNALQKEYRESLGRLRRAPSG